jgi:predicted ATPase/class 3 adenylate cyclase
MSVTTGRAAKIVTSVVIPNGTVTFAFTDIEGSTRRWERHGVAMEDAVRRHDALMRASIHAHDGHVFKTIGDAFCAAFSRPENAVAAMLDAQFRLATADFSAVDGLRVRAAIHTGTTDEREGDYFGTVVNRVARLLSIAHGGQVLISGATAQLLHGDLPADATLRDLGEHRLKDLVKPERVYQLIAPGLPEEFPSLRSLEALPNNLPAMLTSFIGRETELAEITALLGSHRLVTVCGTGGIGKTRTSLQVAANMLDGSGDGVWLIELAPLTTGAYIPSTVAQVFGVSLPSQGDPVEHLARALKEKRALLVFDNCEHLVEPVAHVVAAILRAAPLVKVLASSRQPLGIGGEQAYRLAPLAVPAGTGEVPVTASAIGGSEAIALFCERARAADRRFALTDENAPVVADICRRLDGIPLAIELAAARVNMLGPRSLRDGLDERFRVLTGGRRDVLPRHQTLRALIDWSYDLLEERERMLFRRLATFVNGFTLEGAVAFGSIAGDDGDTAHDLDELASLDVLTSLVDKSLVQAEPQGDLLRYRLLESIRAYAREKLAAAEEEPACISRHLRYLCERFAAARERWDQTGNATEIDESLAIELEDVRAALDAAARDASAGGASLLAAIGATWIHIGLESEGRTRIESTLGALGEDEFMLRARLLSTLSWLAGNAGHKERALESASEAVLIARVCEDVSTLAEALQAYAHETSASGLCDEADAALAEVEKLHGLPGRLRLLTLDARAFVSQLRGDFDEAARAYDQLRLEFRAIGDERAFLIGTLNLADAEHTRSQTQRAIALVRETLPALRELQNRSQFSMALMNLAGYLVAAGDIAGTRAAAREAIVEQAERDPGHAFVRFRSNTSHSHWHSTGRSSPPRSSKATSTSRSNAPVSIANSRRLRRTTASSPSSPSASRPRRSNVWPQAERRYRPRTQSRLRSRSHENRQGRIEYSPVHDRDWRRGTYGSPRTPIADAFSAGNRDGLVGRHRSRVSARHPHVLARRFRLARSGSSPQCVSALHRADRRPRRSFLARSWAWAKPDADRRHAWLARFVHRTARYHSSPHRSRALRRRRARFVRRGRSVAARIRLFCGAEQTGHGSQAHCRSLGRPHVGARLRSVRGAGR